MRRRKLAALLAAVVFCWRAGSSGLFARPFTATSSSPIGVQLAREGSIGGYEEQGGAVGGGGQPGKESIACSEKSPGEPCSFAGAEGQTVNGTCMTIPNQLVCMPVGGVVRYRTGQPDSQPEGAR